MSSEGATALGWETPEKMMVFDGLIKVIRRNYRLRSFRIFSFAPLNDVVAVKCEAENVGRNKAQLMGANADEADDDAVD
jgi:hypothetical protein